VTTADAPRGPEARHANAAPEQAGEAVARTAAATGAGERAERGARARAPARTESRAHARAEANAQARADRERRWAVLAHASALAGLLVPLGQVIGPYLVMLLAPRHMPAVGRQAREAIDFQLGVAVVALALLATLIGLQAGAGFALLGLPLALGYGVAAVAAHRASQGRPFHYRAPLRVARRAHPAPGPLQTRFGATSAEGRQHELEAIVEDATQRVMTSVARAEPAVVHHLFYGSMGVDPENLVVWYLFETDTAQETAEESGLLANLDKRTRCALRTHDYPTPAVDRIAVRFTSLEDIEREAGGNWWQYFK
jgi:uncharacterized Tic20 family protein